MFSGGGGAQWFREPNLKSGGPRFKPSTLPLSWIWFSVAPSLTPPLRLVNSQLVCLLPVGIFKNLFSVCSIFLCIYSAPFSTDVLSSMLQTRFNH